MGKLKSYNEFIAEGLLPDWAKPTSSLKDETNLLKYRDGKQSMTRFSVGDVVENVHTGIIGEISSMGDGMNTLTIYDEAGARYDYKAEDLEKVV